MPIIRNKVTAGNQFDGTEGAGLFQLDRVGPESLQVQINSLMFHTSASCDFVLELVDPTDIANSVVYISATGADLVASNWLLPSASPGSWIMQFSTTGMVGDGWLTIDYDIVRSPS